MVIMNISRLSHQVTADIIVSFAATKTTAVQSENRRKIPHSSHPGGLHSGLPLPHMPAWCVCMWGGGGRKIVVVIEGFSLGLFQRSLCPLGPLMCFLGLAQNQHIFNSHSNYLNLQNYLDSEYRLSEHWTVGLTVVHTQHVFGIDNHYIQDEGRGYEILEVVVLTEHCYFILPLTPTHMHRHSPVW